MMNQQTGAVYHVVVTRGKRVVDEFTVNGTDELDRARRIWTMDMSAGTRRNSFKLTVTEHSEFAEVDGIPLEPYTEMLDITSRIPSERPYSAGL